MRTRRPLSINNSLVHGICNYSCRLCSVSKPLYRGPRAFQSFEVTRKLISRIFEASLHGIRIRYVANSGDGEPTLHPEFNYRMRMFGDLVRGWSSLTVPPPEVSVVTNGSRLHLGNVEEALLSNPLTLIVSLPTVIPESYGSVMTGDAERGRDLLCPVLENVRRMMGFCARGGLSRLVFHVSPPEREVVRRDFPSLVEWLTSSAGDSGMRSIQMVMFPAVSNRAGEVRNGPSRIDTFPDLFRAYDNREFHGVRVRMRLVLKTFFRSGRELLDLLRCFRFPCLWNANFFISHDGSSICCNDQSVRRIQGNILCSDIRRLMEAKEELNPGSICRDCNQEPHGMRGSPAALMYSVAARMSMGIRNGIHAEPWEFPIAQEDPLPSKKVYETRLAASVDDLRKAFGLVYSRYLEYGYQDPAPCGMRFGTHHLLPFSYTVMIMETGKLAGTLTVIRENALGLPMQRYFRAELDENRQRWGNLCELSALALAGDRELHESRELLFSLFRFAFVLSRDFLDCTDFCMMTNPRHAEFYGKQFHFRTIGETRQCSSVKCAEAVPMYMNLQETEERIRRSDPDLYDYFSVSGRVETRQEIIAGLEAGRHLHGRAAVGELTQEGNCLPHAMDDSQRRMLEEYFPEISWRRE